ncbi:amidase signature domain-containing protein [Lasiosphaeria hispida]|uniref:Amidase signature domain-containing protein n=1 Tax=Lasiosphaeria hispida TaxID=260671 RepID=A0AAJ0HU22_9PEZI|nr:amidase signature domain-containing protein [Lasiosphaeria hispida]
MTPAEYNAIPTLLLNPQPTFESFSTSSFRRPRNATHFGAHMHLTYNAGFFPREGGMGLGPLDNAASWEAGSYFASPQGLRPAWRLFPDTHGSFVFPVMPSNDNPRKFTIPGTSGVPALSRAFYDAPSEEKPLSGLRAVIKDVIDMAGVPTSAGNRAYGMLYGVKENNAVCVEKLLDAGAVILGRVKTVQFASGENAKDWFDYQPPFNPRGDGYQNPGCSSAGSATTSSA